MSEEFKEFKQALIRARVTKFIDRYLKDLQDNLKKKKDEEKHFFDSEQNSNDDIITGQWIKDNPSKKDIKSFRNKIAPDLLLIMNALVRAALEKYVKEKGYDGCGDYYKTNREIFDNYSMKYDNKAPYSLNPLNINRYVRNEYLHGEPRDVFKRISSIEEILVQRVIIEEIENKVKVHFPNKDETICELRDFEEEIVQKMEHKLLFLYFAEFLMWRVKNMVLEEHNSA